MEAYSQTLGTCYNGVESDDNDVETYYKIIIIIILIIIIIN